MAFSQEKEGKSSGGKTLGGSKPKNPRHIRSAQKERMQLFCLQLEAFCLQLSFFAYSCVWKLFCLQLEPFYLHFKQFFLTIELLCLQWESLSKKHLNGLQAKKLSCK